MARALSFLLVIAIVTSTSGAALGERSAGAEPATPAPDEPYTGPPTLLRKPPKVGGYVGPSVAYSWLTGRGGLVVGAEASLLFEHQLAIGLAGYMWGNETHGPAAVDGTVQNLDVLYGGLLARYAPFTRFLVYPSVGVVIGAGAGSLVPNQGEVPRSNVDTFFVVEPQLAAHANVTRWARLTLQVGYRITAGISRFGYGETDYDALTLGGGVQLGWL